MIVLKFFSKFGSSNFDMFAHATGVLDFNFFWSDFGFLYSPYKITYYITYIEVIEIGILKHNITSTDLFFVKSAYIFFLFFIAFKEEK